MKNVIDHFRKSDQVIYKLAQKIPLTKLTKSKDYFKSLVEDIISQQLSDKAARAIFQKVMMLFPDNKIKPDALLAIPDAMLRKAGPSWSKVKYLKELAKSISKGKLDLVQIDTLNNEEVIKTLTNIKGIGFWTSEMFLMFSLAREDVFSHGDLGLRKAIRRVYHKKKEPSKKWVNSIVAKWIPYRTYACLLLWRSMELPDNELK